MDGHVATFHGSIYGKKLTRKESDLPADLTNASAATRRVYEPTASAVKQNATHKRSATLPKLELAKLLHRPALS